MVRIGTFGGEYFVWAKTFQISKKYFRIFQKLLEISFPTFRLIESRHVALLYIMFSYFKTT